MNTIKSVGKRIYENIYYKWNTEKENEKIRTEKAKHLMVVAHPDDEMIFFNDFLKEHGSHTVVLCLTNGGCKIRKNEFAQSMESYRSFGKIYNYIDSETKKWDEEAIYHAIRDLIDQGNFETILTHNSEGEYGHKQHIRTHHIVKKAIRKSNFRQEITVRTPFENEELFKEENQLSKKEAKKKVKEFYNTYQSQAYFILDKEDIFYKYLLHEGLSDNYRGGRL